MTIAEQVQGLIGGLKAREKELLAELESLRKELGEITGLLQPEKPGRGRRRKLVSKDADPPAPKKGVKMTKTADGKFALPPEPEK